VSRVVEDIHNALINKLKKSNLRISDLIENFMLHEEINDNITLLAGYGRSNRGGVFEGHLTCIFNKQDEVELITYKIECDDFVYSRIAEEIAEAMKRKNYVPVKGQHLIKKNGVTVQGYKHSDWKFSAAISTNYYNHIIEVGFDRNPNAEDKKAQQLYEKKYQNKKLQQEEQERIERIKREKEQEERERPERIKREKEQEERERRERIEREKEENVKKIFSSVDEVAIKSKVTNYFNNKYIEKIKTYKGKLETLKLGYAGEVNVIIGGDSLGVDVIKIEHEDENKKAMLDNWIRASKYYCILEGIVYYEFQGKISYLKKLNFEYGFGALKSNGKKFIYYRNVPDLVKKACEQNFRQRGEYFFYYLTIDDEVSLKKLELKREERDAVRGRKLQVEKF